MVGTFVAILVTVGVVAATIGAAHHLAAGRAHAKRKGEL
jgi:hypothetical protein